MVVRPSMRFRELFHRIILNLPVNLRWIRHSLNLEEQAREHKEAIERSVAEANALAAEKVAAMRDAELSGSSAAERVKQIAKEKQEKEKEKLKEKDRKENDKEKEKVKPVDDSADTIKPGMYRVYRNLESALNGIDPIPLENLVHSIFSPNSLEMDIYFVVDALPPASTFVIPCIFQHVITFNFFNITTAICISIHFAYFLHVSPIHFTPYP